MGHSLIVGMVQSGKTTLGKQLAERYKSQNISVLVLDPIGDPGWPAELLTEDPVLFLATCKRSRSCALFIDESGDNLAQHDTHMHWLATKARHFGHNAHFLCQRGQQIAKTVRDQCGNMFLFNCSLSDAKLFRDEWNKEDLVNAHTLDRGEFYSVTRFGPVERHKLF